MSSSRRGPALVVVLVALLASLLLWHVTGHETPTGQPPLVTIDANGLHHARNAFNARPEETRLILLLSPT
jgi:hypothetical protein